MHKRLNSPAFTIVELLVVIVVIGLLATIVTVAYSTVTQRATTASLQSDLTQAKKQIENFKTLSSTNSYPTANNCTNTQSTEICLKTSSGNTVAYSPLPDASTATTYSLVWSSGAASATPAALRSSARGTLATHQNGDILLAFACNSSATIPTFSADWTVLASLSSGYSGAVAYKIATSSSMSVGTISSTYYSTASVSGGSRTTTTGSSPSFSAGTATGINSGSVMNIPTIGSTAAAQLQLAYACGIGYGGNPWLIANYSSGLTKLQSDDWHDVLVSSQGTSTQTITEYWGYSIAAGVMVTIKLNP